MLHFVSNIKASTAYLNVSRKRQPESQTLASGRKRGPTPEAVECLVDTTNLIHTRVAAEQMQKRFSGNRSAPAPTNGVGAMRCLLPTSRQQRKLFAIFLMAQEVENTVLSR
jgi:hypothetical protein